MTNLTDVFGLEPETFGDNRLFLEEVDRKTGFHMQVFLTHVPSKMEVYSYRDTNPNKAKHVSDKHVVFGGGRTATPGMFCDYLLLIKRAGRLCPVFVELGETSSSPFIGKKFEQLYSALPIMIYYRASYNYLLNGIVAIEQPRLVLVHAQESEKGDRDFPSEIRLHRDYPRVVMPAKENIPGFSVFYYGGPNKIVKIARTILNESRELSVADIFKALPDAKPDAAIEQELKLAYQDLIRVENKKQPK